MYGRARRAAPQLALLTCLAGACGAHAHGDEWDRALERWRRREPGAYAAWQEVAARGGADAARRLADADALYQEGTLRLERGGADAGEWLRRGAEMGPIDPAMYLRLARACRTQGAVVRAAGFYRKLILESPDPAMRAIAAREQSQLVDEIGDPFSQRDTGEVARRAIAALAVVAALALGVVVLLLVRRGGRVRVEEILLRHPERATAFLYLANVLRHELLKHRLTPLRGGRALADARPVDPVLSAWHRHLDTLTAALGLARGRLLREPRFAAAERAIVEIGRAEQGMRDAPQDALRALTALDRALVEWARWVERTALDAPLLQRLVESLRDERPGRRLAVEIEVEIGPPLAALMLTSDLLLVLRNLARNAIAAAEAQGARSLRIETRAYLDETGQEWARVLIHDPSPARPPMESPADRGLGLVRATLERYGGALVEVAPAPGFAKALAVSVPLAEPAEPSRSVEERAAA